MRNSRVSQTHVFFLGLDVIVENLGGQIKELQSNARLFINYSDILLDLEKPISGHQLQVKTFELLALSQLLL